MVLVLYMNANRMRLLMRVGIASSIASSAGMAAAMSLAAPRPSSLKLYYFDFPFWRAEVARLTLFMGDVPLRMCETRRAQTLRQPARSHSAHCPY